MTTKDKILDEYGVVLYLAKSGIESTRKRHDIKPVNQHGLEKKQEEFKSLVDKFERRVIDNMATEFLAMFVRVMGIPIEEVEERLGKGNEESMVEIIVNQALLEKLKEQETKEDE